MWNYVVFLCYVWGDNLYVASLTIMSTLTRQCLSNTGSLRSMFVLVLVFPSGTTREYVSNPSKSPSSRIKVSKSVQQFCREKITYIQTDRQSNLRIYNISIHWNVNLKPFFKFEIQFYCISCCKMQSNRNILLSYFVTKVIKEIALSQFNF